MEIDFQVSVGYDNRDMSEVIGQVAAPAFLLGGGRSIRLGAERAIDPRHRSLTNIKCEQRRRSHQSAPDIPRMKRRAALLHTSVLFSVLRAIGTSLLVIVALVSADLQFRTITGSR
jgi:hypothetical protein